jgi:hypothetical protein
LEKVRELGAAYGRASDTLISACTIARYGCGNVPEWGDRFIVAVLKIADLTPAFVPENANRPQTPAITRCAPSTTLETREST